MPTPIELKVNVRIPSTPAQENSEFFDQIHNLDPIKFTPLSDTENSQADTMHDGHLTYSSVAQLNPFRDEQRYTQIRDLVDTDDMKTPTGPALQLPPKTYKTSRVPHSQSEGSIKFRSGHLRGHSDSSSGSQFTHISSGKDDTTVRFSEDTMSSSTLSRGRSMRRTPSPTKELEDIKEVHSPVIPPPSPPKRSRSPMKRMFGEHGWLGKSMSMNELPSEEYRKTGIKHWGGKFKKGVGNLTENVSKSIPKSVGDSPSKTKSPQRSTFHVSLSPPMQAKLYSEIELMLCATANQYLNIQVEQNRMSVESLQKVTTYWISKNRPQVIEFMFDQATQRDLVLYNLKAFRFYGPNASNLVAMNSMMQAWKSLAREMAVRTFCAPDSVVEKHMNDAYKVLEMLGAPLVTFLAFQEITLKAKKIIVEEQKKQTERKGFKFGIEQRWEPAAKNSDEWERLEAENPFA